MMSPTAKHLRVWSQVRLESESYSVMSDSLQHHGLYSPWNSPGQNTGVGSLSLFQGIFPIQGSNPGLTLQEDSLPSEPPGKSKNTGVCSQSLLQGNFLSQESNQGLLHCRVSCVLGWKPIPKDRWHLQAWFSTLMELDSSVNCLEVAVRPVFFIIRKLQRRLKGFLLPIQADF